MPQPEPTPAPSEPPCPRIPRHRRLAAWFRARTWQGVRHIGEPFFAALGTLAAVALIAVVICVLSDTPFLEVLDKLSPFAGNLGTRESLRRR
ncbi:hypothetical protein ACH4GK_42165 [Streptomyces rimosus]|uniref:hypothetical protein n=1 Tax=Streptomyces rimosus TaxID=1927 RepID=UPI0004C56E73|nr:hypothetical protein [Streptomyces rimosus]